MFSPCLPAMTSSDFPQQEPGRSWPSPHRIRSHLRGRDPPSAGGRPAHPAGRPDLLGQIPTQDRADAHGDRKQWSRSPSRVYHAETPRRQHFLLRVARNGERGCSQIRRLGITKAGGSATTLGKKEAAFFPTWTGDPYRGHPATTSRCHLLRRAHQCVEHRHHPTSACHRSGP